MRLRSEGSRRRRKGSFPPRSSEVTHVVMERTPAEEAVRWQESRPAPPAGGTRPALLDISWFTESMAAGQPVPVEGRHCLQVSWVGISRAQVEAALGR